MYARTFICIVALLLTKVSAATTCVSHLYAIDGSGQYLKVPQKDNALLDFARYVGTENYRCDPLGISTDRLLRSEPKRNSLPDDFSKKKSSRVLITNLITIEAVDDFVQKYAALNNIDPLLVHAIIKVESNYNPTAVSTDGAMGLMQLMPDTASEVGVSDPFDPEQNIKGGCKYFSKLLSDTGTIELALAAYNSGLGNVRKNSGVPDFNETQSYVVKVQKYWKLAKASYVSESDS